MSPHAVIGKLEAGMNLSCDCSPLLQTQAKGSQSLSAALASAALRESDKHSLFLFRGGGAFRKDNVL